MKIKAVIIDDENLAREAIKAYLGGHEEIELVAECSNGFEGIKAINELKPDLIFLDIQMPKVSGFEMLELIEDPPHIIFSTAYDNYAVKAFEVNAADYLLKPYSRERFDEAVNKVLEKIQDSPKPKNIENIVADYDENEESLERVVVKWGNKIKVIPVGTVKRIEAQDDYVMIHCDEGKFLKQKTMKFFENKLDKKSFIRIHRSHIIRIDQIAQIESFEKDTRIVILKDGSKAPVSKSGYARLKEIF